MNARTRRRGGGRRAKRQRHARALAALSGSCNGRALEAGSQPELGTNAVSLRAPDRPLSGSMAFLGHLGLNIVQKSKEKAKNPLNGARQ